MKYLESRPVTHLGKTFRFGYGSGVFNPQDRSESSRLWFDYSPAERQPGTFRQEVVTTAGVLAQQAAALHRKPFVLLSGGMDSEVVLRGFVEAGVEVEAITFRFADGLNRHELEFVEATVKETGVKHTYFDIDMLRWVRSAEAEELFHTSNPVYPILLAHFKLMSHVWQELNGVPVLGNGDVYLENTGRWDYVELEHMLSLYRHAQAHRIQGGIGFFQHTAELTLSMLLEPRIKRLGQQQDLFANRSYKTSRYVKYAVYRQHWPLVMRPKFDGQELIARALAQRQSELLSGKEPWLQRAVMSYDKLVSRLQPPR